MLKAKALFVVCFLVSTLPMVGEEFLTFSAMGCGPYNPEAKEALKFYVEQENRDSSMFLVYLGDMFPGKELKGFGDLEDQGESRYQEMASILGDHQGKPTFVVPGDNETTDMFDPKMGWMFWDKYFMEFDKRFEKSWVVQRQSQRAENFSFTKNKVLVIGLHKVGGKITDTPYWQETLADASAWVRECLNGAKGVHSAVILAQAGLSGEAYKKGVFESVKKFGRPVVYIHADGHKWFEKTYPELENFYHIQLDLIYTKKVLEGPYYPPVQFTITGDPEKPYFYKRRLNDPNWMVNP